MLLDIFETVIGALARWSNGLGLGMVIVISLGLVLITIVASFIATQRSIERKTTKAVTRLNHYLEKHPFITDENLVEFNKLMKRIPSQMRFQWQQYMVNRDKKPSMFFTDDNCIEKPFKASAYKSHIVATRTSAIVIAVLSFVFCLSFFAKSSTDMIFSYQSVLSSALIPATVIIVDEVYIFFLKARRNSLISELYSSFNNFTKSLDRAVSTLPEYVDYEILFTRKEITSGIPVLQEYLEQRARYEQEQIKRAKESEVVHENYDFSQLGVNGSLLMEKAMRECEFFLGNKKRVLAEISEIESSRDMLDKNYDEKNKVSQRKLRDIRESLDRLKEKLDATTNLIVGNDLRKQRENEIQKQRQLEKEAEDDNRKYEEEKKKLSEQVEAKREEIEGFRKGVESALNNEFMNYADKIYRDLQEKITVDNKEHVDALGAEIVTLQQALEDKDRIIVEKSTIAGEKDNVVADKDDRIAQLERFIEECQYNEKNNLLNERNKEIFAVRKELESRKIELEKKEKQFERQKEYINELKRKKNKGEQLFTDENGAVYYIDADENRKYIALTVDSPEEINNVYEQKPANFKEAELAQQPESQLADIENFEEQKPEENEVQPQVEIESDAQEANSSLGFTDADINIDEPAQQEAEHEETETAHEDRPVSNEEPAESVETKESVEQADNSHQDENVENNAEQVQNVDEVEEFRPIESFVSEIDHLFSDFDNESEFDSPEKEVNAEYSQNADKEAMKGSEHQSENIEEDVPIKKNEPTEEITEQNVSEENYASDANIEPSVESAEPVQEKQVDDLSAEQGEQPVEDIAEIDKMIEEKNAELERQKEILAKQLEETKNLANLSQENDENVQDNQEPEIEEVGDQKESEALRRKVDEEQPQAKKKDGPKAVAKKVPAKNKAKLAKAKSAKALANKSNAGKTKETPKKNEKATNIKNVAKKVAMQNNKAKNSAQKANKNKSGVSGNTPIVNLNLSQFNNQLKKVMKDIDKGNK